MSNIKYKLVIPEKEPAEEDKENRVYRGFYLQPYFTVHNIEATITINLDDKKEKNGWQYL